MLLRNLMYASYRGLKKGVDMGKFNVMFVLGGPGAGKGTQCEKIVKAYGYTHLSAGDLLREERAKPESKVGQLIEQHIVNGSIVPVEITCGLLEQAMVETINADAQKNNFLIDGFPRNKDNLDGWNKQMGEKTNLRCVLFFDCSEQVCVDRCLSRGAGGSGRSDDNMESLKKRINTYNTSSYPIIEHYNKHGVVRKIDASQTAEKVFEDVKDVFAALDQ